MRTPLLAAAAAAVALTAALPSQNIIVPDNSGALTGGVPLNISSSSYPWNRVGSQVRVQYLYDAANFTVQGISFPIIINNLANQASNGNTSPGATYPNLIIDMSTSPTGHSAMNATFALNHGGDLTQVFNGSVTTGAAAGTTPNNYPMVVPLSTTFLYDATAGLDLCIDYQQDGTNATGSGTSNAGPTASTLVGGRCYSLAAANATTATTIQPTFVINSDLTYNPASGLFPNFKVDVTNGASPLTVNFQDTSFSSDPNGIVLYEWDLDGDGVFEQIGAALTAVSHTYTGCGPFSPSLRVTDTLHGSVIETKANLIDTDPMTADFTNGWTANPNEVAFTDLSQVNASSWDWDFDGDGIIDSNLQNPTHTYPAVGNFTCILTAGNACNKDTVTKTVSSIPKICTTFAGGNGQTGNAFEMIVTNPNGVTVTALDVNSNTGVNAVIDVYLTGDTNTGKETTVGVWRQVATGNIAVTTSGGPNFVDINDFYLPPGSYGVGVICSLGVDYTNGNGANQNFFNADITLNLGTGLSAPPGGPTSVFNPRIWNGCIYYNPNDTNVFGFNGESCPSSAGHVEQALSAGSLPKIGTTLSVDVSPLPAGSPIHFMVVGFSNTNFGGIPLPADLGVVPGANMPGCIARCGLDLPFVFTDNGGSGTWSTGVPNNLLLVGTVAYTQVYAIDAAAPHGGRPMIASDAAGLRIGQ